MAPEICSVHNQFDVEIKQLLEKTARVETNVIHVIASLDRLENSLEKRFDKIEKDEENQRFDNMRRDKETAVITTKTNLFYSFFIEKNGIIIIGILTYIVLGRVL